MITALEALRDLLADAVADAECVPDVILTAGRPAAPSDEGVECQTVIYVFGDSVTALDQIDPNTCMVRTRWAMEFEIWTCYPEDWHDQVNTEEAAAATACLYELITLSWCALVAAYRPAIRSFSNDVDRALSNPDAALHPQSLRIVIVVRSFSVPCSAHFAHATGPLLTVCW